MRTVAAVVALVVCVHAGLWALLHRQHSVATVDVPLASVSYSPFTRSQHPDYGDRPTADQIRADLKLLSPYTHTIRTYSSTGGSELVPGIAAALLQAPSLRQADVIGEFTKPEYMTLFAVAGRLVSLAMSLGIIWSIGEMTRLVAGRRASLFAAGPGVQPSPPMVISGHLRNATR